MYLKSISLRDLRCFRDLRLEFPERDGGHAGWFVLLGGNATGKTSLLQAMACALVGPFASQYLVQPQAWLRQGCTLGEIKAELLPSAQPPAVPEVLASEITLTGKEPVSLDGETYAAPQMVLRGSDRERLVKGPYAARGPGAFVCGYGAFRRFSQGSVPRDDMPQSARIASLFGETTSTSLLGWLQGLYAASLDPKNPAREVHARDLEIARGVLDELLPRPVKVHTIDTRSVTFHAPGIEGGVELSDLSDGYRSFLAFALDLLQQLQLQPGGLSQIAAAREEGCTPLQTSGVVLIDEADLHLHPSWQRHLGRWLTTMFPRMQFIVSTHSPFIAQSATPGGLFVLAPDNQGGITARKPTERADGLTPQQILQSPLFGLDETRDPETERLLARHRELLSRQKWHMGLSPEHQAELEQIEQELGARQVGVGESLTELERRKAMEDFVTQTLATFGGKGHASPDPSRP